MPMRKLKNYKPTRFMAETSHYSKKMADFAVMFIEQLTHTKGTWAGKPFELIDWQERIIRDLFGVLKPNGYRQFNTAYIEIPKKMGKSELAAAVALLLCCGDGEERAEVYGCAADRQQATIVFDVAADMVKMCPALNRRVKILTSQKRITYEPTNSFYQVLSAEAYSKHGFNIHGVVFDELHTQPNRKLFDVMTKGSGDARMQPLYFLITTAGNDTNTICYEVHQKAQDILDGRKVDPTFYPVIYGAEPDEDWTDPKVWKKANPSLGITVGIDKVEAACELATHKDFIKFLADIEIYVDGIATMQIQNLNALVDTVRHEIIERYRPGEDDPHLKVLQAAHISDDEYFSHMVLDDLNRIIRDIREAHKKDSESAPQTTVADELKENLEAVENFKGSRDEKLVVLYCKQLGINYKNLSDEEFRWLIRILQKSKKTGTPISQRKKR